MISVKEKQNNAYTALKESLGMSNKMQAPRVEKVVISVGVGSVKDKNKIEVIQDRLQKITGQHAVSRVAKQSIASFKLREGQTVGYQITLRGPRMYDFLDRLLNNALPRTRDFRGVSRLSIDPMGNLTIGIKEHIIFPETADEEQKDIFGLAITIVTSAKDKKTAEKFFEHIGIPFKKTEEKKKK
jgi:large subunit ribosomal protein L5